MSGGVTGVQRPPASVDTTRLAPQQARELEALAQRVDLSVSAGPVGPDRLQFDVLIDGPGGRRVGRLHEGSLTPAATELIDRVRRLAASAPSGPR